MTMSKSSRVKTANEPWDALIRTMMPKPVALQDGLLVGGDPGEVVVRITAREIAVAAFANVWDGQTPRVAPQGWKTFPLDAKPARVAQAIIKARARRLGTYRWCPECHEINPPEWMADSTCQSCSEKHGAVF